MEKTKERREEEKTMEVKKVAEEWKILDKKEEVTKSKKEAKRLVYQMFQVDLCLWEKYIHCQERRGARVHQRIFEERVHQTLKITSNSNSVFCREEEQ